MAGPEVQEAVALFKQGCNCSQALCMAFGERFGLDADLARNLARSLGGGIGRQGGPCGAMTGALLMLGFTERDNPDEAQAKDRVFARVVEFGRRFEDACGARDCRDLLGVDIGQPEGYTQAREQDLFRTTCPNYVETAARILDGMLD